MTTPTPSATNPNAPGIPINSAVSMISFLLPFAPWARSTGPIMPTDRTWYPPIERHEGGQNVRLSHEIIDSG